MHGFLENLALPTSPVADTSRIIFPPQMSEEESPELDVAEILESIYLSLVHPTPVEEPSGVYLISIPLFLPLFDFGLMTRE